MAREQRERRRAVVRAGAVLGLGTYGFGLVAVGWPTLHVSPGTALVEVSLALELVVLGVLAAAAAVGLEGALARLLGAPRRRVEPAVAGLVTASVLLVASVAIWRAVRPTASPGQALVPLVVALLVAVTVAEAVIRVCERARVAARPVTVAAAVVASLVAALLVRRVAVGHIGAVARTERAPRLVIVGIDGGTWDVASDLLARGEMPALAGLIERGGHGVLRSLEPIESPRVWTSIVTGKVAEKHGIEDFLTDRRFIRSATLWDILDGAGEAVGLYDWLVTYPPAPLGAFVVPGWLAGGRDEVYPPRLHVELGLARWLRHPWRMAWVGLRHGTALVVGTTDPARRTVARQAWRSEVGRIDLPYLLDAYRPEVFAATLYATDVLAHLLWRAPDGASDRQVAAVRDAYRRADEVLDEVLDRSGPETTVLVVSDHGFQPAAGGLRLVGLNADRLLGALGLGDEVRVVGGGPRQALVAAREVARGSQAPSQPPRLVRAADALARVQRAVSAIRADRRPTPVFRAELAGRNRAYLRLSLMPDVDEGASIAVGGELRPLSDFLVPNRLSGIHRLDGMIVAAGPGVRAGAEVSDASVLDVAPTVLHLLGLPVARDMDGRVLTELVEPTSAAGRRPITWVESYDAATPSELPADVDEPSDAVLDRLRALGYVSG